jgi:excisionase family DNA binding protein
MEIKTKTNPFAGHLTAKQAAAHLNMSVKSVLRYVDKGMLRGFRIGGTGQYRFRIEDVEHLLVEDNSPEEVSADLDEFITNQQRG